MRAGMSFRSIMGMAELRQLFSISMWSNSLDFKTGATSFQSPKTILQPFPAGNSRQLGKATGSFSQTYTFTGVFFSASRI